MFDPILVAALSVAKSLPEAEIQAALAQPDRVDDAVLDCLTRAADGTELADNETNVLFWGLHILAAVHDTRAFGPLVRLLHRDGDTLDALFGDALMATLPRILVSVFDGDAEPLCDLLLDSTADDLARHGAFAALAYLTQTGRIPRERTHALLVRFDDKRAAVEGDAAWIAWEETIALLGLFDLEPRIQAARRDKRIPSEFEGEDPLPATLRDAAERPDDLSRFDPERFGPLGDPLEALDWTAEGFGQPVRNPWRDVGRNDPCPCGSGRKFKKCCLDKVPA